MITAIRKDGAALVLDGARTLTDTRKGLVVDFGDEMYIVKGCSVQHLVARTDGRWNAMFVLYNEWKGWPE